MPQVYNSEKHKKYYREYVRKRMKEDPEYREKRLQTMKDWHKKDRESQGLSYIPRGSYKLTALDLDLIALKDPEIRKGRNIDANLLQISS